MTQNSASDRVRNLALEAGFDVVRLTCVDEDWQAEDRLRHFIGEGRHGSMAWMEDTLDRRVHPKAMWPDAKSAVVVGLNYGPDHNPLDVLERKNEAAISVYAQNKDYHDLIKKRLKRFAGAFHRETGFEVKVFVDTAPLMEKPLAEQSGLGWQGKHTNLVNLEFGSWLFLGVVLTSADLDPDSPRQDHCGSCTACLDICPTNAFPKPYQLDARKCISYLTIEHKGPIDPDLREAMGNRIYGCDDCLAVCPWNKFATLSKQSQFHAREDLTGPKLATLATLDDHAFRALFKGSPIKRIGRNRFIRNVLIAIGNSNDPSLSKSVVAHLNDLDPMVRGAAVWALSRLDRVEFETRKSAALLAEQDRDVRYEWELMSTNAL